jgi:acetoin utilization protein AcuB
MKISDIMTEKVLKVRMDDSLATVRDILNNVTFHHLLVVHQNKLVGLISDRDILKLLNLFRKSDFSKNGISFVLESRKVHQIMTRNPVTVSSDLSIEVAVKLLLKNNISCLPVVTPEREIEGIVAWQDFLRAYVK